MSTARKGQLCLVGFLLSEVALYLRAFANPSPGGVWVWEGPASLLLLIAGLGLLSSTNRRWAVVAALGAGGVGLLCTVPLSPFPASEHRLEVHKSEGKLLWYRQNIEIAAFRAVFGPHPKGDKELMGDGALLRVALSSATRLRVCFTSGWD